MPSSSRHTPKLLLLFLVAMALVVAGCGSSSDDDDGDSQNTFDGGVVKAEIESEQQIGEEQRTSMKVFFVADDGEDLAEVAKTCVKEYQPDFDMVQCWSFESEEMHTNAELDTKTGNMRKMCWATYAATGTDGEIVTDKLKEKFKQQYQCDTPPTKTTFTKDPEAATSTDDDSADEG